MDWDDPLEVRNLEEGQMLSFRKGDRRGERSLRSPRSTSHDRGSRKDVITRRWWRRGSAGPGDMRPSSGVVGVAASDGVAWGEQCWWAVNGPWSMVHGGPRRSTGSRSIEGLWRPSCGRVAGLIRCPGKCATNCCLRHHEALGIDPCPDSRCRRWRYACPSPCERAGSRTQ
jgi:hypothetical protein